MTMQAITVPFHDSNLYIVEHNGEPYTPMKPIVEGMGISWQGQHEKLKANESRWGIKIILIPTNGHSQDMVCMPLRKLPGWLMSLHPNKVSKAHREKVIQYQNECDDVLWQYWTQGRVEPKLQSQPLSPANQRRLRRTVEARAKYNKKAYKRIYGVLHDTFDVSEYSQIPDDKIELAIIAVNSMALEGELLPPEPNPVSDYVNITVPRDGRFLVIVRNGHKVTTIDAAGHSLINARAASKLRGDIYTMRNALAELQDRMRIIDGEANKDRVDTPLTVY